MNRDRVSESYFGELGEAGAVITRDRIHWMCRQATGQTVLDVGCSQGISTILLAREGFEVVGIDSDPTALAYARELVSNEPDEVRGRILLIEGALGEVELPSQRFDTILLGEVLEHQLQPQVILERTAACLGGESRAVITTPFGLLEHHDHKQTFYLQTLLNLIRPHLIPLNYQVRNRFIFCTARLRTAEDPPGSVTQVIAEAGGERPVAMEAKALEARERSWSERLSDAQRKRDGHYKALQAARERLMESEGKLRILTENHEASARRISELTAGKHDAQKEIVELERVSAAAEARWLTAAERCERLETELSDTRGELRKSLAEATELRFDATRAKSELGRAESEMSDLRAKIAEAQAESDRMNAADEAGEESDESARRAETLEKSLSELRGHAGKVEGELTKARARVESLGRKLEDVKGKRDRFKTDLHAARDELKEARRLAQKDREELKELKRRLVDTRQVLAVAQEKREGHYRELETTREALRQAKYRYRRTRYFLSLLQAGRRYRFGTLVAEALRSPKKVLSLPVSLIRLAFEGKPEEPPEPSPSPSHSCERLRTDQPGRADDEASTEAAPSATGQRSMEQREAPKPRAGTTTSLSFDAVDRPNELHDLRVAAILDSMSAACFEPECRLLRPTPNNWKTLLAEQRPHLLLVESAWHGNDDSWQYKVAHYDHPDASGLAEVLQWCREHGIPTVFWNKEDPVHFDRFEKNAALFDHLFTTDARCIPRYEALSGARFRSVEALPFAAQPRLHNPAGAPERLRLACFAGSYYATRHISRRRQLEMLLDAAKDFGLTIYDRNFGKGGNQFRFPERFEPYIRGGLSYNQVVEAYRSYRVFLNVNSVERSPTMMSRRVFELLACGTAVVSTEAEAIEKIFGDHVVVARSEEQVKGAIKRLIEDDEYFRRHTLDGMRFVLGNHTYEHRLATIAAAAGFSDCQPEDREISVLVTSQQRLDAVLAILARQTVPPGEVLVAAVTDRECDEIVRRGEATGESSPSLRSILLSGRDDRPLRELATHARFPWVATIDRHHEYGPRFFENLQLATRFARAEVIGNAVGEGPEHVYAPSFHPAASILDRSLAEVLGWPADEASAEPFAEDLRRRGYRIYRTDRDEFSTAGTRIGSTEATAAAEA